MSDLQNIAKPHRKPQAGRKFDKKRERSFIKRGISDQLQQPKHQNHKAFGVQSAVRAQKAQRRNLDLDLKKQHLPVQSHVGINAKDTVTTVDPPPFLIAVIGPRGTGKSTVIASLVKHYTNHTVSAKQLSGPITILTGPQRRVTMIECPDSLHSMIDLCTVADLVLLTVDASFGFEMETFECLNILKTHGFPRVMGVLTHLDKFRTMKQLNNVKKKLKHRFWTEICDGAKLFYLSGCINNKYLKREISNLARFISVMKFRPLSWKNSHSHVLCDRMEDLTDPVSINESGGLCDRRVALYGYVRGTLLHIGKALSFHLLGVGDFAPHSLSVLSDPIPIVHRNKGGESKSRRKLNEKEKKFYAPMSDLGEVIYDSDVVYIQMKDKHLHYTNEKDIVRTGEQGEETAEQRQQRLQREMVFNSEGLSMMKSLQSVDRPVDERLKKSGLQMFKGSEMIIGEELEQQIKAIHDDDNDIDSDAEGGNDSGNGHSESNGESRISGKAIVDSSTGRTRRRVLFDDEDDTETYDDTTEGDDEMLDGEGEDGDDHDDSDNDDNGDGDTDASLKWKDNIIGRAASRFEKSLSLMDLVYGKDSEAKANTQRAKEHKQPFRSSGKLTLLGSDDDDDSDNDGGDSDNDNFFSVRKVRDVTMNDFDSLRASLQRDDEREGLSAIHDNEEDFLESLKQSRFVTGDWSEEFDRAADEDLMGKDGDEDDSDVEAQAKKERRKARKSRRNDNTNDDNDSAGDDDDSDGVTVEGNLADADSRESRLAAKAALKESFNSDYDQSKSKESQAKDTEADNDGRLEALHQQSQSQALLNASVFAQYDDETRQMLEGIRPGAYVKIILDNIPCEFIQHYNPRNPLVLGALLTNESNLGYLTLRLKKHRWHQKILKSHDPLIFSSGWRRWQSCPVFSVEDPNNRLRYLKYTPESMHCLALTYGFMAPQGSGLIAYQYTQSNYNGFRIAATASVLDLNQALTNQNTVVKKLKLIGHPFKIYKNTAFIRDMFSSSVEVQKFIGAKIKTVSGIRGAIKKAVQGEGHDGVFRATFEDKILASDIVFVRSWTAVPVIPYTQTVHSLLFPDQQWQGLRTIKQIRIEDSVPIANNSNRASNTSGYDPTLTKDNRELKQFNPLRIPQLLQSSLPFAMKPKNETKKNSNKTNYLSARQLEVRTEYEKTMGNFLQQLATVKSVKDTKRKAQKVKQQAGWLAKQDAEKAKHVDQNKYLRKRKYIAEEQGRVVKQRRYVDK